MNNNLLKSIISSTVLLLVTTIKAQEAPGVFFTTAVGLIKTPGKLGKVFQPSVAFNSGIEFSNSHNWFAQGTLDFNSLKYNQQIKNAGSPYLFQKTSSSLFMLAVNGGKNFHWGQHKWLASAYAGAGYLNIGEPRLVMVEDNIFHQQVSRKSAVFGKAGARLGYKTPLKFLQVIYIDGSWWQSPVKVQGSTLKGLSLFIGTRMQMN